MMPSNHLVLCLPLLLLPSIFSTIWVFSNESALPSGIQSIGTSALASVLPMNSQDWFHLGLTHLISLQSKGLSRSLLQHNLKASILLHSAFFMIQLSHPYMTTGKAIALTLWTFVRHDWSDLAAAAVVSKVMSLLFNILSSFVITFFPKSKCLLISWLPSPSTVILEPQEKKIYHCFHFFPIYLPWSDRMDTIILVFLMLSFKPTFHSPLSPSSRDCLDPIHLLPLEWYRLHICDCYFSWQSFQLMIHPAQHITWCTLHRS